MSHVLVDQLFLFGFRKIRDPLYRNVRHIRRDFRHLIAGEIEKFRSVFPETCLQRCDCDLGVLGVVFQDLDDLFAPILRLHHFMRPRCGKTFVVMMVDVTDIFHLRGLGFLCESRQHLIDDQYAGHTHGKRFGAQRRKLPGPVRRHLAAHVPDQVQDLSVTRFAASILRGDLQKVRRRSDVPERRKQGLVRIGYRSIEPFRDVHAAQCRHVDGVVQAIGIVEKHIGRFLDIIREILFDRCVAFGDSRSKIQSRCPVHIERRIQYFCHQGVSSAFILYVQSAVIGQVIRVDDQFLFFGVDLEQNVLPFACLVVPVLRADAFGRVLALGAIRRIVRNADRDVVAQLVHVAELDVVHVDLIPVFRMIFSFSFADGQFRFSVHHKVTDVYCDAVRDRAGILRRENRVFRRSTAPASAAASCKQQGKRQK